MPNASEKIAHAHSSFYDSVVAIETYVHYMERAIDTITQRHESLETKFSIRDQEDTVQQDPPPHSEEETITLEFSEEEVEAIRRILIWNSANIQQYPHLLLTTAFIYLTALLDGFVLDSFVIVSIARPESLRSKKHLTYAEALSLPSQEDLHRYIANKEAAELSYASFKSQTEELDRRFGTKISNDPELMSTIVEMRARRNIFVHNKGVVNEIYLSAVPHSALRLGEVATIDRDYWGESLSAVKAFGATLDGQMREFLARGSVDHER